MGAFIKHPVAYRYWDENERAAIARVFESDRFTMGQEVEEFENEFASWHGMDYGIMVNSGSSANLVAVASLFHKREDPLRRGDRAIVPAIAWSTTYAPLAQYGMVMLPVDVDDTWNAPRVPAAGARLTVRASILGNPAHDLPHETDYLIEDNCESLGAVYSTGRRCGTTGILNTFSFFWSHQLSAIEGGMILTNDAELAYFCRLLRNHGNAGFVDRPREFEDTYDFRLFGYNVRPLELHAAIARAQLKKLPTFIKDRAWNWRVFRELTRESAIEMPTSNGFISPFGIQFATPSKHHRDLLVAALADAGIESRLPTGGSFTAHRYGRGYVGFPTPRADAIHSRGLFIGNAPWPMDHELHNAANIVRRICDDPRLDAGA